MIIEVCVDSVQSATNAVLGGCNRLELCGNLGAGGGTTPSLGLLRAVKRMHADIPVMVMIRPRTGDFLYSEDEFNVMLEDISVFKEEGKVLGVVVGVLTREGKVDVDRTTRLVEAAKPLQVCFHRAIDMTVNIQQALHDIISIKGITRVLTSGATPSFSTTNLEGLFTIINHSNTRITLLPGSGINARTVGNILEALMPFGLCEIHLSGASWAQGKMEYRPAGMGMGVGGVEGDWGVWLTSQENVRNVVCIVRSMAQI